MSPTGIQLPLEGKLLRPLRDSLNRRNEVPVLKENRNTMLLTALLKGDTTHHALTAPGWCLAWALQPSGWGKCRVSLSPSSHLNLLVISSMMTAGRPHINKANVICKDGKPHKQQEPPLNWPRVSILKHH